MILLAVSLGVGLISGHQAQAQYRGAMGAGDGPANNGAANRQAQQDAQREAQQEAQQAAERQREQNIEAVRENAQRLLDASQRRNEQIQDAVNQQLKQNADDDRQRREEQDAKEERRSARQEASQERENQQNVVSNPGVSEVQVPDNGPPDRSVVQTNLGPVPRYVEFNQAKPDSPVQTPTDSAAPAQQAADYAAAAQQLQQTWGQSLTETSGALQPPSDAPAASDAATSSPLDNALGLWDAAGKYVSGKKQQVQDGYHQAQDAYHKVTHPLDTLWNSTDADPSAEPLPFGIDGAKSDALDLKAAADDRSDHEKTQRGDMTKVGDTETGGVLNSILDPIDNMSP